MSHFQNQVVVLTGASEGIGRAFALAIASQNIKFVFAARNEQRLTDLVNEVTQAGSEGCYVAGDLSDVDVCRKVIDTAIEKYGRIDTLINNAGITLWGMFEDTEDPSLIDKVMHVNFMSAAYCTQFALPWLKKSGGRLVGVASVAGIIGVPGHAIYGASKHALYGFFNSLRLELKPFGVSVTMVAPDFVRTEIHMRGLTSKGEAMGKRLPDNYMSADTCARLMVEAIGKRRRHLITSRRGNMAFIFRDLLPWLVDMRAAKSVQGHAFLEH